MTQTADPTSAQISEAFAAFTHQFVTAHAAPPPPAPPTPLTNPVPGAWMAAPGSDLPPVYVPFEPITRKDEASGKEIVTGYGPGAHHKRLLAEQGWLYVAGPQGTVPGAPAGELASTEAALRSRAEEAERRAEAMQRELADIRAKLEREGNVPNAAKRGTGR